MNNITFGNVLENLLYISNQKKSSLANNLGYDISYINKWISSKHLPSSKRINEICESIAEFIVSSLTDSTYDSLISYFEIDEDSDEDYLKKYIQEKLKEVYMDEARGMSDKTTQNMPKNTHSEEFYNSASSVRPTVVQKGFTNEIYSVVNKGEDLDIVLSFNLFDLNYKDRVSLGNMKKILYEISRNTKTKVTLLMGLKSGVDDCDDRIINALLGINLISTYPALDCDIYNCNVNPNSTISVIKDRFLITTMHYPDGECLLSTYSKDKKLIEEVYYNLMYTQRQKGKPLCEKKTPLSMIEDQTYMQYIMNNDLRCVLGSINEFFMPPDLFMEIAERTFGENENIMNELKKINIFLHNATYKSKLKVLIYETELRKYLSSGCLHFFNTPVILTFKERERHIEYLEKILMESKDVEIRMVDGNFVDDFRNNDNPSLYLSRSLKISKMHPITGKNYYSILSDIKFKDMCDELFEAIWNDKKDVVIDDKEEIIERISKSISYTRIMSENLTEIIK
ncbi:MAG: hypothetical protein E6X43_05760 [Peptostreptococcaceae bacterium]|nr:hypothetical protein [Peptostreptococcaceae bacterium]